MKVSVLGSGSFGTAIANVLGDKSYNVFLYGRRKEVIDPINEIHENIEYLRGFKLSEIIRGTTDLEYSLKDTELIVFALPTQQLSKFIRENLNLFPDNIPIVCVAKGIEENTLRLVSEILEEELPGRYHKNLCYLSGPSFAKEIVQRYPTLVSIASKNEDLAKKIQNYFYNSYFRTYWHDDVIGVEVGGALKNVIAIACGVSDGLNLGHNTRAALIIKRTCRNTTIGCKKRRKSHNIFGINWIGRFSFNLYGRFKSK